jgi:hypothetical protein
MWQADVAGMPAQKKKKIKKIKKNWVVKMKLHLGFRSV